MITHEQIRDIKAEWKAKTERILGDPMIPRHEDMMWRASLEFADIMESVRVELLNATKAKQAA